MNAHACINFDVDWKCPRRTGIYLQSVSFFSFPRHATYQSEAVNGQQRHGFRIPCYPTASCVAWNAGLAAKPGPLVLHWLGLGRFLGESSGQHGEAF